ncbi:MAG TPA: DUF4038 domain-containing protein [Chryseolinea sp.]|nr:DUF4038 domain-containing protein [Chryseolinea sp.]
MKKSFSLLLFVVTLSAHSQSIFPLKISENRRYFTTQQDKPFLYHADTGWQIFITLTTAEAVEYLAFRKAQGFNTIQVQLAMSADQKNRYGNIPFDGDVDFSRPNEKYHNHIVEVLKKADSLGLLIVMAQPWLGCCKEGFGNTPEKPIQKNGVDKNRSYGKYLGKKFSGFKNLFWMMGGDNDPRGDRLSLVAFAEGLYESAPKHQLLTYHASAPHSSTDLFQYSPWLGFSFIYTYWREKPTDWVVHDLIPHVYEAALREWSKSDIMPFVLGESQYEGSGIIENDMGTPQIVRRQAYWTMLCGGAGHSYGSDIWNFPANWRDIMRYPGATHMGYFIKFFEQIKWWTLVPDVRHQAVVSGYGDYSKANYVTTAVSSDKKLMVSYLPEIQSIYVDFNYLSGTNFKCSWFNPSTGKKEPTFVVSSKSVQRISPKNGEDWVLVVEGE